MYGVNCGFFDWCDNPVSDYHLKLIGDLCDEVWCLRAKISTGAYEMQSRTEINDMQVEKMKIALVAVVFCLFFSVLCLALK